MKEAKDLAEEHWKWLRRVIFETYKFGVADGLLLNDKNFINDDATLISLFERIRPLIERLYIDSFIHGYKHAVESLASRISFDE